MFWQQNVPQAWGNILPKSETDIQVTFKIYKFILKYTRSTSAIPPPPMEKGIRENQSLIFNQMVNK